MPRTERTEHEIRIVMCLNTECEQYRVGAKQYAMQMAFDPLFYEENERVLGLVFLPVSCAKCGRDMVDQEMVDQECWGRSHGV